MSVVKKRRGAVAGVIGLYMAYLYSISFSLDRRRSAGFRPRRRKRAGVRPRPSRVEETRPPTITVATGARISLPASLSLMATQDL